MSQAEETKKKKATPRNPNSEGGGEGTIIDCSLATDKGRKLNEKKPLHTSMEQLWVQGKGATNASRKAAGANWHKALATLKPVASETNAQTTQSKDAVEGNTENSEPSLAQSKSARLRQKRKAAQLRNKYVAMDCEMVGVGCNGQDDMLARVSIVNKQGDVLLDKFVKPREAVTDYRTCVSGIRPHNIENGEEFSVVQDEVVALLQGKILVGHAIRNDLAVLHIKHPYANIRDTSRYKPLCRLVANGRTPSLKRVCQAILGLEIQTGEHNSVEDARAAMNIYNRLSVEWEKYIQKHHSQHRTHK